MMGLRRDLSTIELIQEIIELRERQVARDKVDLKASQFSVKEEQENITQGEKQLKDLRNALKILEKKWIKNILNI